MQNLVAFLSVSPHNFLSNLSLLQRKAIFILVIVEINCMNQRKEKTGICESVVIAIVVAIRDVVQNRFHCKSFSWIQRIHTMLCYHRNPVCAYFFLIGKNPRSVVERVRQQGAKFQFFLQRGNGHVNKYLILYIPKSKL